MECDQDVGKRQQAADHSHLVVKWTRAVRTTLQAETSQRLELAAGIEFLP